MRQKVSNTAVQLPVHSLGMDCMKINIVPLDYNNPYDFKREHRHTYYEIMIIERGGGNQLVDFKNYVIRDNSCYIIFPHQIHLMHRNNSSGTIIQFTEDQIGAPELRTKLKQLFFSENAAIVFENRPEILVHLQNLLGLLQSLISEKNPNAKLVVTNMLNSFISMMILYCSKCTQSVVEDDKKLLIEFYDLLEKQYCKKPRVQYFAQKLGITEKKLAATTQKFTGLKPLQLIHNRILLEAKRLLVFEENTHKEIAYQLSFDSPAAFSAFIKIKTGFCPSELKMSLAEIHK
jgi:AraC family transcriptional activator of pobA